MGFTHGRMLCQLRQIRWSVEGIQTQALDRHSDQRPDVLRGDERGPSSAVTSLAG